LSDHPEAEQALAADSVDSGGFWKASEGSMESLAAEAQR